MTRNIIFDTRNTSFVLFQSINGTVKPEGQGSVQLSAYICEDSVRIRTKSKENTLSGREKAGQKTHNITKLAT